MSNFVTVLLQQADRHAHKPALIYLDSTGEHRLTYSELVSRARACAAQIPAQPGDRAVLAYTPGLEFAVAYVACLMAGVIPAPTSVPSAGSPDERLRGILADCQPAVLMTNTDLIDLPPGLSLLDSRQIELSGEWSIPCIQPEDLVLLQYTSGSTGMPKGVMVSHENLLANCRMMMDRLQQTPEMIQVSWLPRFHDMGLVAHMLQPLFVGNTVVFMSPLAFMKKPLRWLTAISQYRGNLSGGPNSGYELCIRYGKHADNLDLDLSCWDVASVGAEPLRYDTLKRFARMYAPYGFREEAFYPGYGMAEATLVITLPERLKHFKSMTLDRAGVGEGLVLPVEGDGMRVVSCGYPAFDYQIRIVDPETGVVLPSDRIGEIWYSGDNVAQGYWQNPAGTAAAFEWKLPGEDRLYLRTGDLGYMSETDGLYITGRYKDLIIVFGRNYHPEDIEVAVLACHPLIRPGGCVVFGDETEGVVVVAELRSRACDEDTANQVIEAIRQAMIEQIGITPAQVVLVAARSLPRTTSGKSQRRATKALLEDLPRLHLWQPHPTGVTPDPGLLCRLWAEVLGADRVYLDDNFFELGGDSIKAAQLMGHIEDHTGVHLSMSALFQTQTVREMMRLLQEPASQSVLVPLRDSGSRPPLYCIHPRGGHLLAYHQMVRHLGDDQPVYGLQAVGLSGHIQPLTDLQKMAAHYIQAMKEHQPQGPYELCGFSLGGAIAFEMANQLHDQGDQVGLLLLIDTLQPDPQADRLPRPRFRNWLYNLLTGQLQLRSRIVIEENWPPEKKVLWACRIAEAAHTPRPYPGDVVYIHAKQTGSDSGIQYWHSLTQGTFTLLEAEGDHESVLQDKGSEHLATVIRQILPDRKA